MKWDLAPLLWLVPVVVAWVVWSFRKGGDRSAPTLPVGARVSSALRWVWIRRGRVDPRIQRAAAGSSGAWLALACGFVLLALARPLAEGLRETPVLDRGDIVVALDVSRSMEVADVRPSRFERAKRTAEELVHSLRGNRFSLVVFAGDAFEAFPLSASTEVLLDVLPELKVGRFRGQGTRFDRMLSVASAAFDTDSSDAKLLVILSDGEAHSSVGASGLDSETDARLRELRSSGVRIAAIGIGTADGGPVPGRSGTVMRDAEGRVVRSRLEPHLLIELARRSDGRYWFESTLADAPGAVDALLAEVGGPGVAREVRRATDERFQWFLAPAIAFLLLALCFDLPGAGATRPRTPSGLPLRRGASLVGITLATATGVFIGLATESPVAAAPGVQRTRDPVYQAGAAPSPASRLRANSELTELVIQLANRPQLAAKDYATLAFATIALDRELVELPLDAAHIVLDDGEAAVAAGRALDPAQTDWSRLADRLAALRQRLVEAAPPSLESLASTTTTRGRKDRDADGSESREEGGESDEEGGDPREERGRLDEPDESSESEPAGVGGESAEGEASGTARADPNGLPSDDEEDGDALEGTDTKGPPTGRAEGPVHDVDAPGLGSLDEARVADRASLGPDAAVVPEDGLIPTPEGSMTGRSPFDAPLQPRANPAPDAVLERARGMDTWWTLIEQLRRRSEGSSDGERGATVSGSGDGKDRRGAKRW